MRLQECQIGVQECQIEGRNAKWRASTRVAVRKVQVVVRQAAWRWPEKWPLSIECQVPG